MVGYNRFNKLFVIIFLVIVLSFGSSVFGADWLTFKGGLTRTSLTNEIIKPPIRRVEWTINAGFPISMSPVSKGDFVYFGTEGGTTDSTFYCLLKGKKIWEFPNDKLRSFTDKRTGEKPWPNGAMDFARTSLKISPTIHEKKVYLPWGSKLLILNYESGILIDYVDLKDFGHEGSINTSPLIHDDHKLIICGSTNGYLYGFDIELRDPLIRWRIPEGAGTGGTISSAVAYSNRQIFFGSTSKMFYSYELTFAGSDGVKAGTLPTKKWEVKLDGQISQTPAVIGSNVVITTRDGYVYCLSASTGDIIWEKNTASRIDASPVIATATDRKTYVVIIEGKNIKCFNIEDGSQKWSSSVGEICYGTPK
ncbi:MAG: PQQ-binding-like beta-propeller repeat protein [Caldisericia bacterium]